MAIGADPIGPAVEPCRLMIQESIGQSNHLTLLIRLVKSMTVLVLMGVVLRLTTGV